MNRFFELVGMFTVTVFLVVVIGMLYSLFVHPVFQAISIMRWFTACSLSAGNKSPTLKEKWNFFKWGYEIGGVRTTRYSNNMGEWCGIGRWQVYKPEDEEAP
ncbi:hypothetical protein [Enterobacter phage EspM4VN]|uniref:Uncharacterized protein n=1 Tax=Enterobacter phage EspM4VN TaxID=2137745 RepID=A0A2Z6C8B3_9CAUD|nr:hypothetical protein HYP11_gp041 [Enterobacter phage EspM4VN]BBD52219.1 hypothetical protein [Enterobacter phage EspM4VN]